jgi:hypothetical protein
MTPAGFEPAIPEIKRLQSYALELTTTGIGLKIIIVIITIGASSRVPACKGFYYMTIGAKSGIITYCTVAIKVGIHVGDSL